MKTRGLEGKRIIVTGASGFIGSHLARELRRQGAEVLTLDVRQENSIDLRDWKLVREFGNRLGKLDLVYHLAAMMFVPYSFDNPRETYDVNVQGTLNILELSRICKVNKVVFASSYVYGPPKYLPVDEEHPLNPGSPYARSKIMGENLCKGYHEDYGLVCTILRPFNIYGEGQSDSFLISSILKQMPSGRIVLMDPEPRRDFLHISDMIDAYLKAGQYSGAKFQIFNIGSGVSYSVGDIVTRVMHLWGKDAKVRYLQQRRRTEIMNVVANVQKAKRELDWTPRVSFDDGLRKYIEWYKNSKGVVL